MNDNGERGIVPVLNSSHSTVKIDSLCIKLGINVMKEKDNDAPKCRHFSIRGYVSGMRGKGTSNLLPFTKELPPMEIPNFRYWLCEKCLLNNEVANASTETTLISGCDRCVFSPSVRSCPQRDFNGPAVLPFGEGTSGHKSVDKKNNGEIIPATLEADESQTSQLTPDKVKVAQELTKLCTIDTNAGQFESNELKDHESHQNTSIVNETTGQPFESDQQIDNYQNGQPRRKARKVRLLKELLCGNTEIQQQNKDNSSPLPPPSQVKRKVLLDHHDHEHHHHHDHHNHDPKRAKSFKGDAIVKNNVVESSKNPEAREFGENMNKYEWNKHGNQRSLIHGKIGSDPMTAWRSIFRDMGRTENRVLPTYSASKSRGTEPSPNFMNPLKSDKKLSFSKKISSNPIKGKFSVEDSRRMNDDNRSNTELGLNLSLNYDPQSDIRSKPSFLNRPPNQDYNRKTDFFLGETSNFPHRIQSDSTSKEKSTHEKRLYTQLPYGSCSGHQKLDFSDPYKRNVGVRGYSEFTRPNNHQRQENVFSIGRSDEREVVELMAKNQYERNLCEANNGGIISGFRNFRNEGMTSSHHEYLSMIRPPSSSTATSEQVGPMRNPTGGFFHQDQVSSFTMNQKKPFNGVWMSDSGPQRHYDSRYHYASNGSIKPPQSHLYNATNMQVNEAFNKYNNGTRQHDTAHMQFGQTYERYSDKDKGKNMMDLDLNLVAPNVVEEQNNFESLDMNQDRTSSLDASYSNETIPAMQLLSLMDAGKLSQPFSVTGQTIGTKPKPKPISSCFSHCSSTMTEKTNPMANPIGSSYSNVFRTGQNVKLTTSSHGQQVFYKQQEVMARGTSLASVGSRPEGSYVFPLTWQGRGGQNKPVNIAFGPKANSSRTEICTINRNPADFSTPGPENEYMINVEELVCNGESSYGSYSQKKAIKPTS